MLIWIICAVLSVGILLWCRYDRVQKRRQYIGYGWILELCDEGVKILARLNESPAGRAGVPVNGCWLRYVDGNRLSFNSVEEFKKFLFHLSQRESHRFGLEDFKTGKEWQIVLTAERIQGPIPYYSPPPLIPEDERHALHESIVYVEYPTTGQAHFEVRRNLSNEAIENVLLRRN